jgi:pimeloyl-ACP methyl ester carboxylesterase
MSLAYTRIGVGSPVVAVHGSGASGARWAPVADLLGASFSLIALDRRGHGASGDASTYRIEDEFDDLVAFVESLHDEHVDVVAHSYGAVCALGAALRGARIRRLVLYEPPLAARPGDYCPPGLVEDMRSALARGDADRAAEEFARRVLDQSADDVAAMRRLSIWAESLLGMPLLLRELEALDRYRLDETQLKACAIPVLLMVGSESAPPYQETANMLHRALPASRVAVLPGQKHGAIGAAPQLFADTVRAFLDEPGAQDN